MSDRQKFCLSWNDCHSNIVTCFKHLKGDQRFADVTLASNLQTCKAHKMVLSACSPYFKELLEKSTCKHPIVVLKDVPFNHLQSILEYMYTGEVSVPQECLEAFLAIAAKLLVKGLSEVKPEIKEEKPPIKEEK